MIEKTPIGAEVRALCTERFAGGSGCSDCPIRAACHSGPTANLTYERLNEWRERMNAAAESLKQPNTIYTNTP